MSIPNRDKLRGSESVRDVATVGAHYSLRSVLLPTESTRNHAKGRTISGTDLLLCLITRAAVRSEIVSARGPQADAYANRMSSAVNGRVNWLIGSCAEPTKQKS